MPFSRGVWLRKGLGGLQLILVRLSFLIDVHDVMCSLRRKCKRPFQDIIEAPRPGGDNNLNVVVADYAPHVRCDKSPTSGPPWKSCLSIVADMEATRDRQVFGDKNRDPRVEVHVPHIYKASEFNPSHLTNQSHLHEKSTDPFYWLPLNSRREMPTFG